MLDKQKWQLFPSCHFYVYIGVPTRIRTAVTGVKGPCPRPLDDGDILAFLCRLRLIYF